VQALRWHGREDVRLDEVPEPEPGPGEVVVRVAACGICGSDLHEYLHGPLYIPTAPHPLTGVVPPVTLGHEFCGRIEAVGHGGGDLPPGTRVTVNPCLLCRQCVWCRRGQPNLCARLGSLGLSRDGAFAPLVAVPAYACRALPDGLGEAEGAMVEPLAVAVHATRRARLGGGEAVAVVGAGPIGLLLLQVLKAHGAGWVAVIEPRPERRRLAASLGADAVIDPDAQDPARRIAALTSGERAAVAFECVGSGAAFSTALRVAGKGGRVVLVGLVPATVEVSLLGVLAHEKEIVGSSAYVDEFDDALRLLSESRVRIAPLVTARIPLAAARDRGLDALGRPEEGHVKILVTPDA
jgi:(R,R)-butanediol dehydrogenase/meso-butanediol dehydrogenase/diacetyl reductase